MNITMRAIILCLLLSACASPITKLTIIDGAPVFEHIDHNDNPCGNRGLAAGCQQGNSIWYSSVGPAYVRDHELAHIRGMRHGEWRYDSWRKQTCTVITVGIEGYPQGAVLCHDGNRQAIYPQQAMQ